MERWQNKIAVVTGASAGIGSAICKALVEKGMIVVGLARRIEKIESDVKSQLSADKKQYLYAYECDVSDEQSVKDAFAWIEKKFGGVDVLVNNAGICKNTTLLDENSSEAIKSTVDINILGVVWCTQQAFQSMRKRNVDGHVVLINSVAGHMIPRLPSINFNIYPSTKYAITAMTEVLRQEFLDNKTKIKITSISPGAVRTEILNFPPEMPVLQSEDVAEAVVYCLQTPPHVQIHELIIKPVGEIY